MKALRALLLIPLIPVFILLFLCDMFTDFSRNYIGQIIKAVLGND